MKLITINISHYCEKVRWALDYLNVEYIEEHHAPPFHRVHTKKYGGVTVPVLVTEQQNFCDSTDILRYLNSIAPEDKKLYPNDIKLRKEVEQLEELFDSQLGVATRCLGYYFALQNSWKVPLIWTKGTSWSEKIGCILSFPMIVKMLKHSYQVNETQKNIALQNIKNIFSIVDKKLAPEKKYLVGDKISAADISFAALAAPLLRPRNHPIYSAKTNNTSQEMVNIVKDLRKTRPGKFALRLYSKSRRY